ncbi:MAG: DNA/RNA nuclease SfsA [Acidobacteriota bacterium]
MRAEGPLMRGTLIRRYQRFLMDVRTPEGDLWTVHCPNSGSMEGCLAEGAEVVCSRSPNPGRKLPWTAEWIRLPGGWVGINTHRANAIVGEALRAGRIAELAGYQEVRPEVPYGKDSRVDFLLTAPGRPPAYVEVKNTTWPTPDGGVGFPDSVTERGLKHLRALARTAKEGGRAIVLFLVNREDGNFFRPAREKDPAFAAALRRASRGGVEVLAYRTRFRIPEVEVGEAVRVDL